jgi:hypothetical protein
MQIKPFQTNHGCNKSQHQIYQMHKLNLHQQITWTNYMVNGPGIFIGRALQLLRPLALLSTDFSSVICGFWFWRNFTQVFSMARPRMSLRFIMLRWKSRLLLIFLDTVCHYSSYIRIAQNIDARGFVSYAISCFFLIHNFASYNWRGFQARL